MTDEDELSHWQKAKLNFWNLLYADSDEQFDETVGQSVDKAQDVDYKMGLLINLATIAIGYSAYWFIEGIIGIVGLLFAILSVLSILKWVVQG